MKSDILPCGLVFRTSKATSSLPEQSQPEKAAPQVRHQAEGIQDKVYGSTIMTDNVQLDSDNITSGALVEIHFMSLSQQPSIRCIDTLYLLNMFLRVTENLRLVYVD